MTTRITSQVFPHRAVFAKTVATALATAGTALLTFATPVAHAEPVLTNNCPAVGDLSAQMAGWRNRGKTQDQALAQVDKYYSDPADRQMLHRVVELVYLDPHKRLVPEQVSVQITSQCLTQQADQEKAAKQATHP
ncbi:hypothetical protein [Robbsia sp. KACC 23696]|uniref:hypothetical protein n=1 Tax=Robbsia sp. KACC 23696 TaxID=3149231 RepID=UPI00325B5B33